MKAIILATGKFWIYKGVLNFAPNGTMKTGNIKCLMIRLKK